ncbi:hypothetical protein AAFF_G00380880 [Aldrovandia affinis]|uniref:Centriole, cilia and spindle-associated protein n=1 Tax=Aldrovandia affinis TaxID=143900 RepID=A0AAD7X019_9TELE|nr:hypothetical protein AAFF_G00380880 [Aldrovandia affinis]
MVTKKNRSEYMKKFKDPPWETCSQCYEDSLKYRVARRLLEHAHKPWFWEGEGWDSGSESSGRSTPNYRNKVEPLKLEEHSENETSEEQERDPKDSSEPNATCPVIAEPRTGAETSYPLHQTDAVDNGYPGEEDKGHGEKAKHTGQARATHLEPDRSGRASSNPHPPRKPARAKSQPPREHTEKLADREKRHPFSLNGWAEKRAETAINKTHNVCTSAPAKQIHPPALRAKTRRDVEKRGRAQDRRRVRSADVEKVHKMRLDPADDPWMTEYMRCFSARSR